LKKDHNPGSWADHSIELERTKEHSSMTFPPVLLMAALLRKEGQVQRSSWDWIISQLTATKPCKKICHRQPVPSLSPSRVRRREGL